MVDGRFCIGFADASGDVGHLILDPEGPRCLCGERGCFEGLASRRAVLERIHEAIREGRHTVLADALNRFGVCAAEIFGRLFVAATH